MERYRAPAAPDAFRPARLAACEHMFLSAPRRHPNARSFRGLVDGVLDFALLRDEGGAEARPERALGGAHPHRRALRGGQRRRPGAVAPRTQVCVCPVPRGRATSEQT